MKAIKDEPLVEKLKQAFREPDERGNAPDYWFADGFNSGLDWAISCIASAEAIDLLPNDPLTLDELREMDGEPVYLDLDDGGEWSLVRVQQGKVFVTHKNTICAPAKILFECGGKAYRRKPEEGTA